VVRNELGFVHLHKGEYEKAIDQCLRSLKLREEDDLLGLAYCYEYLARVYAAREEWDLALKNLSVEALPRFERLDANHRMAERYALLADIYVKLGKFESALAAARKGWQYAKNSESPFEQAVAMRGLGGAQIAIGLCEEGRRSLSESCETLAKMGDPYQLARSEFELGVALLTERGKDKARKHLTKAAHAFRKLGAKCDLSKAQGTLQSLAQL